MARLRLIRAHGERRRRRKAADKRRCIGRAGMRKIFQEPFYKRSCASVTAWRLHAAGSVAASSISAYFSF